MRALTTLTEEQMKFLRERATKVRPGENNETWYHLPQWFCIDHTGQAFEVYPDEVPAYVTDFIKLHKEQ